MPKKRAPRVKEVAVSFVRRLTLEEKVCPQCGQRFEGVKKRLFCSRACQAKHDYQRHAAEYRQKRVESYRRQKAQAAKH